MKTKKVSLFYKVTQSEVISPDTRHIEIKNRWVEEVQKTVPADWQPKIIKVTYEEFDPEIEDQRKFFHICVRWYAIQNEDMVDNVPDWRMIKAYREEILDDMLGYEVQLITRKKRERKSTTDFKTVQAWYKFLKELEETKFESAGYFFPESESFWKLVSVYGYEKANEISIKELQKKIILKNKND